MADVSDPSLSRREFVQGTVSSVALAGAPAAVLAAAAGGNADKAAVLARIPTMHAANVKRLQDWIALPSIAAENLNYPQGAQYMMKLAQDAGFTGVKLIPTSGKPGVFGTIDAGARTTMGIYFMYDVKQFVPAEWSSPPLEARLVAKQGLGTVCMGRGAVNQKGPENSFLSAWLAFRAAGKKLPVSLVLVCEGEEEIASPDFREMVMTPEVMAELRKCAGVFMPEAGQDRDGGVQVSLGAKGVVELELISSGEKWGRGPTHDVHSSLEAQVDSPSWHLVQALSTLVGEDGHTPAVDGFFEKGKALTAAQEQMARQHADPGATCNLQEAGARSAAVAAFGRLLAGLCVHRRAAEIARGSFRPGPWDRRTRSGRVLPHQVEQFKGPGAGRSGRVVRGVLVRPGLALPAQGAPGQRTSRKHRGQHPVASNVVVPQSRQHVRHHQAQQNPRRPDVVVRQGIGQIGVRHDQIRERNDPEQP